MIGNYITLHRQIEEWEWYKDIPTKVLFIHLLLEANHKDGSYKGVEIKRGQLTTSVKSLSQKTGLSIQQTRTALTHLKSTNEITIKSTNKYSLITIEKYDFYQSSEEEVTSKVTNKLTNNQQTKSKNLTTNNKNIYNNNTQKEKYTKKKKGNEIEDIIEQQPIEIQDHLRDFLEMRKSIKKPITTTRAMNMLLNKLQKLAGNDLNKKQELLDEAILHNWQSVYIPDGKKQENKFLSMLENME